LINIWPNRYITPEQVPVKYGGLSREGEQEFTTADPATEVTIKPATKHAVEFPVSEVRNSNLFDIQSYSLKLQSVSQLHCKPFILWSNAVAILLQRHQNSQYCGRNYSCRPQIKAIILMFVFSVLTE